MKLKIGEKLKGGFPKPRFNFGWIRRIRYDAAWGIMAYLHFLVVVPIIFKRRDEFVRYHTKQGIAVLALWVLLSFSFFVPVLPWIFAFLIIILVLTGIVNVILSKKRALPVIGKLAENF